MHQTSEILNRLATDPEFREEFRYGREDVLARFTEVTGPERQAFLDLELSILETIADPKLPPIECRILQIAW